MLGVAGVLVLAALTACSGQSDKVVGDDGADVSLALDKSGVDRESQEYIGAIYRAAQSVEYDVISGNIDLASGGFVSGVPASWPQTPYVANFRVDVPAQESLQGVVSLEIWVQKTPFPLLEFSPPAFVIQLKPDLVFDAPVTVSVSFPRWIPTGRGDVYVARCIFPREGDGGLYDVSDVQNCAYQALKPGTEVTFQTSHFSVWEVSAGKPELGGN